MPCPARSTSSRPRPASPSARRCSPSSWPTASRSSPVASPQDFKLQDGTVVDHLPVGTAARALTILGLPRDGPVTVGINVPSGRYGKKDIIRVEGMELRKSESDRLALLGTHVTVSIVKGGRVSRKHRLEVPERLVGVIRCDNPTC